MCAHGSFCSLPLFLVMAACAGLCERGNSRAKISREKGDNVEDSGQAAPDRGAEAHCVDEDLVGRDQGRVGLVEERNGHLRAAGRLEYAKASESKKPYGTWPPCSCKNGRIYGNGKRGPHTLSGSAPTRPRPRPSWCQAQPCPCSSSDASLARR